MRKIIKFVLRVAFRADVDLQCESVRDHFEAVFYTKGHFEKISSWTQTCYFFCP